MTMAWTYRGAVGICIAAVVGCDAPQAAWTCALDGGDVVDAGTMTCADWRDAGDQQLAQASTDCTAAEGAVCTCTWEAVTCAGSAND